ncbi:unnamed protein product [Calicophoron daubneyi]|uniref:Trafficking protein particle complex subunit 2-like protein n=1 Tax=Calicophoron daubneyi TaxID=300641 RepID=A0AAV2T7N8_CALDB
MAACIAVISDTNQLLYLRTADCPDPLFYHFKVHAALDVIEDKLTKRGVSGNPSHEQTEQYLGLLYPMEDHRLYGYVTNTQIKFVIIQESQRPIFSPDTQITTPQAMQHHRDVEVRSLFQRLHMAYVELVSCPFYTPRTPILRDKLPAAARFDNRVSSLLAPRASSGACPILPITRWTTTDSARKSASPALSFRA